MSQNHKFVTVDKKNEMYLNAWKSHLDGSTITIIMMGTFIPIDTRKKVDVESHMDFTEDELSGEVYDRGETIQIRNTKHQYKCVCL